MLQNFSQLMRWQVATDAIGTISNESLCHVSNWRQQSNNVCKIWTRSDDDGGGNDDIEGNGLYGA